MLKEARIILNCIENAAGSTNAAILGNGDPEPNFAVQNADCAALKKLYERAVVNYGKTRLLRVVRSAG